MRAAVSWAIYWWVRCAVAWVVLAEGSCIVGDTVYWWVRCAVAWVVLAEGSCIVGSMLGGWGKL